MSDSQHEIVGAGLAPRQGKGRRRSDGWRSGEVLRTAALVMGMYWIAKLAWVANPLLLTAFLGILFGLAVAAGADRLERFGIKRGIGAALVVLTFFGLLVGFGAWMAPTLRSQGIELRRRLPDAMDRFESWARAHQNGLIGMMVTDALTPDSTANDKPAAPSPVPRPKADSLVVSAIPGAPKAPPESVTVASTLKQRLGSKFSGATRFLFPFLTSTMEAIGGLLIIVFLSIYIGADPELYHRGTMQLFPRRRRKRGGEVLSAIATQLRRWLITQLIAMATIGVVTTILLLVLRVKAAFALGLLSGLFEFIPTVGPILSAIPAVAMAFLDSPEKALIVGIAYFIIQFLENHLLIPLLMKGGIDAPPALTILSQALMAMTFGFLGLMCAVPLLAATMVAVKMLYVEPRSGPPTGEHSVTPPPGGPVLTPAPAAE